MTDILNLTLITIVSVGFIIGILGNTFMALVNIMDWVKRRKISSVDLILTALSVSRIAFLCLFTSSLLLSLLYPGSITREKIVRMVSMFFLVTNHFSIWLATCLSIFYFFKIANFSNSLFLYLKWRVEKVVSVTLLMSLLLLFINIVIIYTQMDAWVHGFKANISYSLISSNFAKFSNSLLFTNTMFTFIPFTMSLMTFLLLIFSLLKHLKNMHCKSKGSRDVSTAAHIKALQTVVAFLLLYTLFSLALLLQSQSTYLQMRNPSSLFWGVMGIAFPSGHSCVLIVGNSKLRRASLWCLRCRMKEATLLSS
uniref:Taste receptor type 2 n=1 Tax=Nannospalax galili TaxID=1026970 RepID=A0A0N9NKK3_NANGA|nr:taste receptor type 2 member 3 [Nannospalax galili]